MSSSKKSKKGSDQIPKPIGIKKEKLEEDRQLHHISHYIDDRLELVKQIFATLKPKTIINLAPEFLKKAPLEEIEERCLDELLCISTKRLKSIIEDKPCPSDTESSEDSDVQQKEEHISLEEISSDSDIGGQDTRRAKKKKQLANSKKSIKKEQNEEPDGQISVLELLELQARARAIRSQLAMEPITKIEVKSDDDDEADDDAAAAAASDSSRQKQTEKTKSKPSKSNSKGRERTESQRKRKSSEQQLVQINDDSRESSREGAAKKIRIKRNYRQANKTPERQTGKDIAEVTIRDSPPTKDRSRSASPDVIPIQTETETLLISDSTDEDEQVKGQKQELVVVEPPPSQPSEPIVESEPEEGEVRDEVETEAKSSENIETTSDAKEEEKETTADVKELAPEPAEEFPNVPPSAAGEENSNCSQQSQVVSSVNGGEAAALSLIEDEDQNDDVISIGGDLENEMIEQLAKEEPTPSQVKSEKTSNDSQEDEMDNDVISLDTSEDDHDKLQPENSESWRTRYLKSSKVSQVLAESRLGKRVRDKIKKSKRAQKHDKDGKDASTCASSSSSAGAAAIANDELKSKAGGDQQFASKHEDGSIEQYQELLQHHRQRKSSNNSSKSDK